MQIHRLKLLRTKLKDKNGWTTKNLKGIDAKIYNYFIENFTLKQLGYIDIILTTQGLN